jgi:hypothetical protein
VLFEFSLPKAVTSNVRTQAVSLQDKAKGRRPWWAWQLEETACNVCQYDAYLYQAFQFVGDHAEETDRKHAPA